MGLVLKHNLNESALEDLLSVFDAHVPQCPFTSKYLFNKGFKEVKEILIIHNYCQHCETDGLVY